MWASNWPSLMVFLACETQWRTAAVGMAGIVWLGIDYAAADVVMRRQHAPDGAFDDLCVMERAALTVFMENDR